MKKIIPHVSLVLSLMTLVFFVISRVNDAMAFMTSDLSQWVFALLAVASLITAICLIRENLKEARRADIRREKKLAAHRAARINSNKTRIDSNK